MPKYAQFDPVAPSPQPVTGWYDTDEFNYPNLPPSSGLLQLTQAQWDTRQTTPFIQSGQLIPAPAQTLAQVQAAQIALINSACQAALATIIAPYPPSEVDTWTLQYNEAQAYTANATASTPTLSAIVAAAVAAGGTGYTVAAQAASVLTKASAYTAASGAAVGKRQALTDKINAATTVAAVKAIVW